VPNFEINGLNYISVLRQSFLLSNSSYRISVSSTESEILIFENLEKSKVQISIVTEAQWGNLGEKT